MDPTLKLEELARLKKYRDAAVENLNRWDKIGSDTQKQNDPFWKSIRDARQTEVTAIENWIKRTEAS